MKTTILFDLGNTLVRYYEMPQFPGILDQSIQAVLACLEAQGSPKETDWAALQERVAAENHEDKDYQVRPLAERLARICRLEGRDDALSDTLCRRFMGPIFALGSVYPEVIPTLEALKQDGYRTAIVTNTPWGSPSRLWHEEIDRLGLASRVDLVVCCGDVGWRKPAEPIFRYTMETLGVDVSECLFVGDDPRWDIVGPRSVGMEAVLLDRSAKSDRRDCPVIQSLTELLPLLGSSRLQSWGG